MNRCVFVRGVQAVRATTLGDGCRQVVLWPLGCWHATGVSRCEIAVVVAVYARSHNVDTASSTTTFHAARWVDGDGGHVGRLHLCWMRL